MATHRLFKTLPADGLHQLARASEQRGYAKGEPIYTEVGSPQYLWVVKTGHVRLLRYSSSGRTFALGMITAGGLFCIPALIKNCRYPCRAVAGTDATLLRCPATLVGQLLSRHSAFGYEALRLVCEECCRAHALCSASQESVDRRLLALLVHLLDAFGSVIPLNQQQLAEMAGMARETASRTLLKLAQRGIVRLAFGRVTIQDPVRLRACDREDEAVNGHSPTANLLE